MKAPCKTFEVIVGNIGTVYSGNNYMQACMKFQEYKSLSMKGVGRASNEPVTIIQGNNIKREHLPPTTEDE
jgi:hypothetical protein